MNFRQFVYTHIKKMKKYNYIIYSIFSAPKRVQFILLLAVRGFNFISHTTLGILVLFYSLNIVHWGIEFGSNKSLSKHPVLNSAQ